MASAEVLRIIDIKPDPSADAEPISGPSGPDGDAPVRRPAAPTARLALWPSPAENAIVTHGEPVPVIDVRQIIPCGELDPRVVMLREPGSRVARSFRLLRHRLLGMGDPRVIAVGSARSGEGKTTCAVNLAIALSEEVMTRVLLLEADLRRPVTARLFAFEPHDTILESMMRSGEASPPYPVASVPGTRMHVAALPFDPLDGVHLDRTLFAAAISDLRDVYDYIVIDAGSVLESNDAHVATECASAVIATARAGKSRRHELRRALDQLRPAPIFGTVLFES
jgi:Mrp family chromosome partitioning ATPase